MIKRKFIVRIGLSIHCFYLHKYLKGHNDLSAMGQNLMQDIILFTLMQLQCWYSHGQNLHATHHCLHGDTQKRS